MLPIKTYTELEADPINPILNAFKLKKEGEGMAIQIIISPAPKSFKSQVTKAIKNLKEGQSFKKVLGKYTFGDFAKEFASSVAPKDKSKEEVKPSLMKIPLNYWNQKLANLFVRSILEFLFPPKPKKEQRR